jgi:hypothetical protein
MGAYVLAPAPIKIERADQSTTGPASNLTKDHPAKVWRSSSATSASIDISGDSRVIDTIALVGSNLAFSDVMFVRFADTLAGLDAAAPISVPGYTGNKSDRISTKTIISFPAQSFRFIRVTVLSSSPKVFEAQRLVVGRAVRCSGLDYDAKFSVEDNSPAVAGVNYQEFRAYKRLPSWRATITVESDDAYYDEWMPFFTEVGTSLPLLFVPDDESPRQNSIIFGRITAKAEGTSEGVDYWSIILAVTAVSP